MAEANKISLRDIDLVVSYREANEERRENLYTVLAHLRHTYTDYRLWLLEAAAAPSFDWRRLGDPNIRHVFVPHDGPFPKSMLYNTGVRLARSPVVCFHDADSIAQPQSLRACVDALMEGQDSDALCPYWSAIASGARAFSVPRMRSTCTPREAESWCRWNIGTFIECQRTPSREARRSSSSSSPPQPSRRAL